MTAPSRGEVLGLSAAALAVLGLVVGALTAPLLAAAAVMAVAILLVSLRWPLVTAFGFLITGPLFLSQLKAGPLTLDDLAVIYGTVVSLAWLLRRRWRWAPVAVWPASVGAGAVIAAAANAGAGAVGVVRFVSLTVLALLAANAGVAARRRVVTWVEVAVTVGAIALLAQPLTNYPDPYQTWGEGVGLRYGGFFGHPNFAAYSVSLVLLFQLYTRRFHTWRAVSAVLLLLALVMTGSRAALLGFALMVIPALWVRARRFFALLLPALAALPFVGTAMVSRFENLSETGGLSGQNASGWRFGQWHDALMATRGHEWLGIGWGQTESVLSDNLGAHSTYIQIWLELGRVGAVVTAAGFVLLVRAARRSAGALILIGYATATSISDPVLVYPCCATILLLLLSGLLLPVTDTEEDTKEGVEEVRDDVEAATRFPVPFAVGAGMPRPAGAGT